MGARQHAAQQAVKTYKKIASELIRTEFGIQYARGIQHHFRLVLRDVAIDRYCRLAKRREIDAF